MERKILILVAFVPPVWILFTAVIYIGRRVPISEGREFFPKQKVDKMVVIMLISALTISS